MPESPNVLDVNKVKPLLDLTKTEPVEVEFIVGRTFLQSEIATTTSNNKWNPSLCPSKIWRAFVSNADYAVGTETLIWGIYSNVRIFILHPGTLAQCSCCLGCPLRWCWNWQCILSLRWLVVAFYPHPWIDCYGVCCFNGRILGCQSSWGFSSTLCTFLCAKCCCVLYGCISDMNNPRRPRCKNNIISSMLERLQKSASCYIKTQRSIRVNLMPSLVLYKQMNTTPTY